MMKPRMVERKVKLISVQASPSVKKITNVRAIALGCDQKKPSTTPVRAPISHKPTMPTRMPICVVTIAHNGQSFCTGKRRTGLPVGVAGALGAESMSVMPATCRVSWTVMSGRLVECGGGEQVHATLFDRDELRRQSGGAGAGPRQRNRNGFEHSARPRAHHVDFIREINRLLDVVGDEHHCFLEVAPKLHQPFLHLQLGL